MIMNFTINQLFDAEKLRGRGAVIADEKIFLDNRPDKSWGRCRRYHRVS
jgi:hypothetical protein